MHFVGWLLDETMGRPGLPTLCILIESCNDAVYVESPLRTFALIVLRILTAHANYALRHTWKRELWAVPKFRRELERVSNFNQSINWHRHMKDHVENGHLTTGNQNTFSNKNKCTVIYLCPCVFFESFRRDLNEAKAVSCNIVNYLISSVNISHLPLCNYDVQITSQVSSNVVNY